MMSGFNLSKSYSAKKQNHKGAKQQRTHKWRKIV
jgi:hypothetical protein